MSTGPNHPQEPQEPGQTPPEGGTGPQTGQEAPDPVEQTEDVRELRSEAAKRRRALREEEAKTAALTEQVDGYQRAEVERLAGERLADPNDLWMATSLDAMRGDDGAIDMQRVELELDRITREKPHWKKSPPIDLHAGARQTVEKPPSFSDLFKKSLGR